MKLPTSFTSGSPPRKQKTGLGFQMELAVLLKNIDVAQQYLNLTQERFNRGITNELDVTLAERQLATLATADLFPHVVLVGGAGMQGQGLVGRNLLLSPHFRAF
jgi:hypothetical protein